MRIKPWMRVTFSAVVVLIILWRVPIEALWSAFGTLDCNWLWPALACSLATLAVRKLKWQRLLQVAGSRALPRDVTRSLFGGFALGIVTPGRLGEFGRCLFVPETERAHIIPLNILDRILDSWSVATYAVVSLFLTCHWPAGIFALTIWLAFLPIVPGLPRLISSFGDVRWWSETSHAQLQAARESLGAMGTAPFAVWALISTSLDILTFYFVLRVFHPAEFITALATYPWIILASGIPLSLGGLGPREGAAALLLTHYAIPAAVAADVALFLFAFLNLLPAMIGGVWLLAARSGKVTDVRVFNPPRPGRSLQEELRMSEE